MSPFHLPVPFYSTFNTLFHESGMLNEKIAGIA